MKEYLVCGKLLRPRGLKGEIGVYPSGEEPERFLSLHKVRLVTEDGEFIRELLLSGAKVENGRVFLSFEGVEDRDSAGALTGLYLAIPRSECLPLEENSWYASDLLGCTVIDREHGEIGKVADVLENSAHVLLEVTAPGEAAILVPFLKDVLDEVDLANEVIRLTLPDGLYEIYR